MTRCILLLLTVVSLTGCVTKEETIMNTDRMDTFENLNIDKVYAPVTITGIKKIEGDITITTQAEHRVVNVPDIQYDTSDAEVAKAGLGVVGVLGALKLTQPQSPTVVTQPEPIIVDPVIVTP